MLRHDLLAVLQAGIGAADAGALLAHDLQRHIAPDGRVVVIAAGKASATMASAAADHFGARIRAALVVAPAPVPVPPAFELIVGGHPAPTPNSEHAGRRALSLAESLPGDATLVVLLSGGASALMVAPVHGLTLEDKRATTTRLMHAGADIKALNVVRKHLSAIKGGRLAVVARGRAVAYVISDVVGDDPSVIASGPTVADPTTYADALAVLGGFGGLDVYPQSVVSLLTRGAAGELEETPKPGDARLTSVLTKVIGSRRDALAGAAQEAAKRGYRVVTLDEPVVGEARLAARRHLARVVELARSGARPLAVVSAGETVVTVTGRGTGGRNQEFALAVAEMLPGLTVAGDVIAASVGTDGIDGPTDAAGALVDATTAARAQSAGVGDPRPYLDDNNAHAFFAGLGDLIHTGPTDTNVGDLQVVLFA